MTSEFVTASVTLYDSCDVEIKSLAKLKEEAGDYSSKLNTWYSVADATDTDVGNSDATEAGGKLESEETGNITEESITEDTGTKTEYINLPI